jgi:Flp pilus assembly protein TadG
MSNNFKKLQSDERGSIAILFALTAFVLFWCVGLAVDGARYYGVQTRVNSAIDAAALAGARGMRLNNLTVAETEALTRQYFKSNFEATGGDYKMIQPALPQVNVNPTVGSVEIIALAKVPTIFGTIGGIDNLNVARSSVAVFSSTDLEISMQLDLTGSMGWDSVTDKPAITTSTKISELQTAAKDFVDIMIPNTPGPNKVRIGLAPFSAGVNAGAYLKAVDGGRNSSDTCTFERKQAAYQDSDDVPTIADPLKIASDLGLPPKDSNNRCPTASVMAMTDDKVGLSKAIDKFAANDSTAGHLGAAWAHYLLSPKWQNIWNLPVKAAEYDDKGTKKFAVLMTDGQYNTVGANNGQDAQSTKFALDTCKAMKDKGVTIYTVGFLLKGAAKTNLEACATPGYSLNAENGPQLRSAFRDIANQITTLKLTQ